MTRARRAPGSARADVATVTQAKAGRPTSSGCRQGRRQPKRDARHECHRQAEGQHVHVDRQIRKTRDRRRPEPHQRAHEREGETGTGNSAEHPQHEALGQQLRDQLAPARAEGRPHGDLAAAGLSPREQQVRDVRTGDEQHERDGAEQGHERRANVANDPLVQRRGQERRVFLGPGKLHGQAIGDRLQRGRRLAGRHGVLQARQHLHPLRAARLGCEVARDEDERLPELRGGGKPEGGGSDPDDRHGLAV